MRETGAAGAPTVTVVIPAYNAARWIGETLDSVLAQTFADLEVVVVDDGSTDDTARVVRERGRDDVRVRLVSQPNSGVAAARNRGIAEARGRFVAPLDADDFWFPEKLEMQVEAFGRAPGDTALVYCWSAAVNDASVMTGGLIASRDEGETWPAFFLTNFVGNASAPLVRADALAAVGGFDTEFFAADAQGCEDKDLYLRLAERFRFGLVPRVLVGYRDTPGSMSAAVERMERSHALFLDKAAARRGGLPRQVRRWSTAFYSLYLARKAAQGEREAAAIGLQLRAAVRDPGLLACGDFWRLLRVRLIGLARRLGGGLAGPRRPRSPAGGWTREALEARAAANRAPARGMAALRAKRIAAVGRLADSPFAAHARPAS